MELIKRNIHMDCIKTQAVTQFTLEEAVKITEFLNLKDPVDIFFAPSVPKMQHSNESGE